MKKSLIAVFILVFSVSAIAQVKNDHFKVITYNIWNGYDWGNDEVRRDENEHYMVLGDFNSHSPYDADLYDPQGLLLTRLKKRQPDKGIEEGNLSFGDLDYSVMSALLAFALIDVCRPLTSGIKERGSFPGRVLGPVNNESDEDLVSRLERIDYILTSPSLSIKCTGARVCNGEENHYLSDHYPVMSEFDLKMK